MKYAVSRQFRIGRSGKTWLYVIVLLINLLVFAGIGASYIAYSESYRQKLYEENLNSVANLNAASANAADMYISSMGVKIDDIVSFVETNQLSYDETVEYLGESNTNPDRQLQLIKSAVYINGQLDYGNYKGVSVRKLVGDDGRLTTLKCEVSYARNYGDLTKTLRDVGEDWQGVRAAPEFTDSDTKLKCFSIYRHIFLEDSSGERCWYTLLLSINAQKAMSTYNMQNEFDGQSTVLIKENGDYIIKNNDFKGANFYEYLQNYNDLTLDECTAIKQDVIDTLYKGALYKDLFYRNYDGSQCVFCVSAMNNDWYSVTCVPEESFSNAPDEFNYSLLILLLFLGLFAVDGVVIYFVGRILRYNVYVAERAMDEANTANQAKSRFLSTMSHELRTPLNAVIGLVSLSGDNIENPLILSDYLRKIDTSSKLLLQLISDILDVSAIESSKMKISSSEFDLTRLISSLSSIYYDQCVNKGIEFNVVVRNIHSETLIGDPTRLNQVLLNFLSNAVKFTPKGGKVTLKVTELSRRDTAVTIGFEVIDTGCGISDELKTRLFKPFEQESGAEARKYGGTGLGLSIAKNLTELMKGSVSMESTEGEGSRFSVEIPFELPAGSVRRSFSPISGMRILAAVSDEESREYLGEVLTSFGIERTLTDSALEAVRLLEEDGAAYSLCMLDWKMRDLDALSAAREIRGHKAGRRTPIMVLAYDLVTAKPPCIEAGVDMVLVKPVFPSALYNALEEMATGDVSLTPDVEQTYDFGGRRVLLAEDNALNTEIACLLLTKVGLEVVTAENGRIAYAEFAGSPEGYFDAILMDIQMPIMNGYLATEAIRGCSHPQAAKIPILAMTADAFSEDVERAVKAGMNAHIPKPIEPDMLYAKLQKYIMEAGEKAD